MASNGLSRSALTFLCVIFAFLSFVRLSQQAATIQSEDEDGNSITLSDDRKPALYTQNFGDCLGGSVINVTRFNAAYYKDNMTVLFHLQGNTNYHNESLMMHIGVYAFGQSRFDLTFNPCNANIESLCPMKPGVPIDASGIIPISQSDVAGIIPIALTIPDFEGQATLRVFANSTQSEVGCFSASVTNGHSFSQPAAIGTVIGIFVIVAVVSSFAAALQSGGTSTTRHHYAHSVSVFLVFAVLQHIFFSGALSMNWPSVLPAFWSNFAWSGGMIHSTSMQSSVKSFVGLGGHTTGNASIGANGSAITMTNSSSTLDAFSDASSEESKHLIATIYQQFPTKLLARSPIAIRAKEVVQSRFVHSSLVRRVAANASEGYSWFGKPTPPGLPLPGNFTGFGGTLSEEDIPAPAAFITCFLWFLVLLALTVGTIVGLKWILEGMCAIKLINNQRFKMLRERWLEVLKLALLRVWFISFFMMTFLTMFQFSYHGTGGVAAIAALVFLAQSMGMLAFAGYCLFHRLRHGKYVSDADRLNLEKRKLGKSIPWYGFTRVSRQEKSPTSGAIAASIPWWQVHYVYDDPGRKTVHEDEELTLRFGWLLSRFRRTRWWFFSVWLVYEFLRACFYGGAQGHPRTQLASLLVIEILAFIAFVVIRPFESTRLNFLLIYALGTSKILTLALSCAFDPRYNLDRIIATAIGIVIIVIQSILTILLLVAIVVGAVSTYMSLTRENEEFRPRHWLPMREKYLEHVTRCAVDSPRKKTKEPAPAPVTPYFQVSSVRRLPKIEDEDADFVAEMGDASASRTSLGPRTVASRSRASSLGGQSVFSHSTLPYGARIHRNSWSIRDFENQPSLPSAINSGILRASDSQHSMLPLNPGPASQVQTQHPLSQRSPLS